MTSKPVVLRVPITELPTLVEQKSKQTALSDRPVPMSLPINDIPYSQVSIILPEAESTFKYVVLTI